MDSQKHSWKNKKDQDQNIFVDFGGLSLLFLILLLFAEVDDCDQSPMVVLNWASISHLNLNLEILN